MLPVATSLRIIKTPWATYTIVAANIVVHFLVTWNTNFVISDRVARTFGFSPASFGNLSAVPTLVTSIFFHILPWRPAPPVREYDFSPGLR